MIVIPVMIFYILLLAGIVWLQIFLSKSQSKWPGLILPFISFLFSVLMICSVAVFNGAGTLTTQEIDAQGNVISQQVTQIEGEKLTSLQIVGQIMPILLISNIPTVILIGIYASCRGKNKEKQQLGKMSIQDLE